MYLNVLMYLTAYFLWQLENPKPMTDRRFFKRYLTFWHMYNICSDCFFLIGLLMKLMENLLVTENEGKLGMIDMNQLAASGRILWGAAFSLAILKTIKVYKEEPKTTLFNLVSGTPRIQLPYISGRP